MTEPGRCSSCGLPLDLPGPAGLCPACLLKMGLAESGAATGAVSPDAVPRLDPAEDVTRLSAADVSRTPLEPSGRTTGAPGVIGPYRLLQTLGEGGMGLVYLAEQERPLRRRVAVKVIKLGMDTREVVARFEAERQALASCPTRRCR